MLDRLLEAIRKHLHVVPLVSFSRQKARVFAGLIQTLILLGSVGSASAEQGLINGNIPIKGVFFFAGAATNNLGFYTLHPTNSHDMDWSDPNLVIAEMAAAGVNTIMASTWGPDGTDYWFYWAPMETSNTAVDQLFDAVELYNVGKGPNDRMYIIPVIEQYEATPTGDEEFYFVDDFLGSTSNPAPKLVERIHFALDRWGHRDEWARLEDRSGTQRHAVNLLGASTDNLNDDFWLDHIRYADGLNRVADTIQSDTGFNVGFTLEIPFKEICWHSFCPTPNETGPWLAVADAFLALQMFNKEHSCKPNDHPTPDQVDQMKFDARNFIRDWASYVPVILDVNPGYHAEIFGVGPWGFDDTWMNWQSHLKGLDISGVTYTAWNGYTEGYAAVPVSEYDDYFYRWLTDFYRHDPRECSHKHYVNGNPTYDVYGLICEEWTEMYGPLGALGDPISSEHGSLTPGARMVEFEKGNIYWKPGDTKAYAVYRALYTIYHQRAGGEEEMGLPIEDARITWIGPDPDWWPGGWIVAISQKYEEGSIAVWTLWPDLEQIIGYATAPRWW